MALLSEYAITPNVFDVSSYPHEEVGTARLEYIKDAFLEDALLRNLHNGKWMSVFANHERPWHNRGMELLKKMSKQNRIRLSAAACQDFPVSDSDWCREAMASHNVDPLVGVIATARVVDEIGSDPRLGRIDRLGSSPCWTCRSQSVRLRRCRTDYEAQLRLIMCAANSVMFIDPHMDPTLPRYADVLPILLLGRERNPSLSIEIHRVIYVGTGPNRQLIASAEWDHRFRNSWSDRLSAAGLQVEVFIWDDHHDRYLITDLLGIEMGNGFDTTTYEGDITTWTRISRKDRDDIQREFDPNGNRHSLIHRFTIP
jgi:hypothetical protein